MKISSNLIWSVVFLLVGTAIVVLGALFKINEYSYRIFDGAVVMSIGMMMQIISIFYIVRMLLKRMKI